MKPQLSSSENFLLNSDLKIIPYESRWPAQFLTIAVQLKEATKPWGIAIHHIGSTAVEGLAAKDIIDIQITVESFELMEKALITLGFRRRSHLSDHRPPGRQDLKEEDLYKWFFESHDPSVNLHVRIRGKFNQRYSILCRDFLRSNLQAAKAYEAVKMSLAKCFPNDISAYYDIKDPVFDVLMAGAEIWALESNGHLKRLTFNT